MHVFHPSILRRYDIRGIVGETLSEADARAIGRAFATQAAAVDASPSVAVGFDGRLSSPALEAALVEGLSDAGASAVRVGLGPTPMAYFAHAHLKTTGMIQVTGSHNPPDHNGFKMMLAGKPFFGGDIERLGAIAADGAWADGQGSRRDEDVSDAYLAALDGGFTPGGRPLSVVWDPGNGAAGVLTERLIARLPGRHAVINAAIDGRFPNHHPDPTDPATLRQLQAAVAEQGADLGIAFDGDGDRLGVIDGRGRILWGDQYLLLLAREVLEAHPGAPILADVKASQTLFDEIAAMGGKPVITATGHSLIKTRMAELGAPLAGEMSGHVFFADRYYGFDDALYAAVRLLSVVARLPGTLADWFDTIPRPLNTPELRIDCPDEKKAAVVDGVRARLKAAGAEVSEVDGVRVSRDGGWWLLRASNTQAVLVARAEAPDQAALGALVDEIAAQVSREGLDPAALRAAAGLS
ncbi:phosphoglucomutase/phosphomannomutase PgmG [Roseospira navarrensis]|uniref:Phosphomannomutase n=1 Tax=Roseospira navarrensis TaxID=140058 RepID=A0A7X2D433_9PROT|nr:phosphomannomutase/phosphoglucomutase [Roseospira navarrensis]MQX37431.1 phosphomannomutase [Roseospira navarrensis]